MAVGILAQLFRLVCIHGIDDLVRAVTISPVRNVFTLLVSRYPGESLRGETWSDCGSAVLSADPMSSGGLRIERSTRSWIESMGLGWPMSLTLHFLHM